MLEKTESHPSVLFLTRLTLLAWLSMIGVDFFLHAGLLAPLYSNPSPFLLPPARAFTLIPVGYASFLLLAILLVWLMINLGYSGWMQGGVFGAQLGAVAWGALILGLYSISTAPVSLLFGWFIGQSLELGVAGIVVGVGLKHNRQKRLFFQVVMGVILLGILSILLQNIGSFSE